MSIPVFLQQCFWELSVYVTPVKGKKGILRRKGLKLDLL